MFTILIPVLIYNLYVILGDRHEYTSSNRKGKTSTTDRTRKQHKILTSSKRPSSASDELPTPPGSPINTRRATLSKSDSYKPKAYPSTRSRGQPDAREEYMESDNQTNESSYDDDGMYKEFSDDDNYEEKE